MCSHVWYVSDELKNKNEGIKLMGIGQLLSGTLNTGAYHIANAKNPFECPKCGTSRITKETVTFWVDNNGNHIG